MAKSFNAKALGAFKKLGVVALITATLAMFFTACNQTGNTGGGGGGKQGAPFVEGGASLILSPDKLTIKVRAGTEDGSAITVEGCNETTLASDVETTLNAKGTKVILKGKITELDCSLNELTELDVQGLTALQKLDCSRNQLVKLNVSGLTSLQKFECRDNKLTALDVQGLTALQELDCSNNQLKFLYVQDLTSLQSLDCQGNQLSTLNISGLISLKRLTCSENKLNAQAMTELLNALPAREATDKAIAKLYLDYTYEGNCKDFSTPESLKTALDGAKKRNWKLIKKDANGKDAEIE